MHTSSNHLSLWSECGLNADHRSHTLMMWCIYLSIKKFENKFCSLYFNIIFFKFIDKGVRKFEVVVFELWLVLAIYKRVVMPRNL